MDSWTLLLNIVWLLGGCIVAGGLFARFGQSPLVGYLLAGMLLGGPGSFQIVESAAEIEVIAELGVSLLLFSLGLEFSWQRLKSFGSKTLFGGALQVVLTLVTAAGVALACGLGLQQAIAIGAMVAVSSTACVLRVFLDRGEVDSAHGRKSLAILLVQDIAVVLLAIMVSFLGDGGSFSEIAANVGRVFAWAAGLVLGLYILIYHIAVRLFGVFTIERNRELAVLLAITIGLGSTWAAHAIGVSPALGAFIAGMLLGGSAFATQVRADISSLRVILLTLFFGAAGMVADPIWIWNNLQLVVPVTILLLLGKATIIWFVLKVLGHSHTVSVATGVSLAQVGEFAFVLGAIARDSGALSEELWLLMVSCVIISLFLTPYLIASAPRVAVGLASLFSRNASLDELAASNDGQTPAEIVVIGFGPAGQTVANGLLQYQNRLIVIDLNQKSALLAEEMGFRSAVGDSAESEVLEHARIENARIVVVTIPHHATTMRILRHVRVLAPKARLVARSRHQRDVKELELAGAHIVVGDEEQVGRELAHEVTVLAQPGVAKPL